MACLAHVAIERQRAGEFEEAENVYLRCLQAARDLHDHGRMATYALNLGTVAYELCEPSRALEHYETARKLALRAGRVSTAVMAQANLAHLWVFVGRYEEGARLAKKVILEASQAKLHLPGAQAMAVLGDAEAGLGNFRRGVDHYRDALNLYRKAGHVREVVETLVDLVQLRLNAESAAAIDGARSELREALRVAQSQNLDSLLPKIAFARSRLLRREGRHDEALEELQRVVESRPLDELSAHDRWVIEGELGACCQLAGDVDKASAHFSRAHVILERWSIRLAPDLRDTFWRDPRRARVRDEVQRSTDPNSTESAETPRFWSAPVERLLSVIRQVSQAQDLDSLLDRITQSAREMTEAERVFLLMPDDEGQLRPRAIHEGEGADATVEFSKSIAESVLIDREPLVTFDAQHDDRVKEFLSVHELDLRAVACLPIVSGPTVYGVLYLEHRGQTRMFSETYTSILRAFADQVAVAIANATQRAELQRLNEELREANERLRTTVGEPRLEPIQTVEPRRAEKPLDFGATFGLLGKSRAMQRVFEVVDRVAASSVPVAIVGESGTGKELIARAIHGLGARSRGRFVAVNCAAIPDALIESELFGHEKGAFSGADRDRVGLVQRAHEGTLFLDEVGDMSPLMQVALLRTLQDGSVRTVGGSEVFTCDVRTICATHRDLEALVEQGKFRRDLYFRLRVVQVEVPPLRERREDIGVLCDHFLKQIASEQGIARRQLSPSALRSLERHPLPGNVRQLQHILWNACVLTSERTLDEQHLVLEREGLPTDAESVRDLRLRSDERARIIDKLRSCNGNRAQAARELGILEERSIVDSSSTVSFRGSHVTSVRATEDSSGVSGRSKAKSAWVCGLLAGGLLAGCPADAEFFTPTGDACTRTPDCNGGSECGSLRLCVDGFCEEDASLVVACDPQGNPAGTSSPPGE